MAREIDWSQPLSDEDRTWAEQRPDLPAGMGKTVSERLQENDEQFGKVAKDNAKTRDERIEELRTVIADSQNEIERLAKEQSEEDNRNAALSGTEAVGLVRDNTSVDGEAPEGAPIPDERYADEKVWTKAKLTDEIKARNEERVSQDLEPLSVSGNRAELVERLLKDDEELEG